MSTCHCGRTIRDNGDECRRCQAITRANTSRFAATQRARFKDQEFPDIAQRSDPTIPDARETQAILERARNTDRPEVDEARSRIAELKQKVRGQ